MSDLSWMKGINTTPVSEHQYQQEENLHGKGDIIMVHVQKDWILDVRYNWMAC